MVDIVYTATRRLVNPLDDEVTISQALKSFDRSPEVKKSSAMSLGGVIQSTLHNFTDDYSVTTMPVESAEQPEFDEFIYSTINAEEFTIQDPDDNTVRSVQRVGDHNRTRVSSGITNVFIYSFNVREVI
jgi:hypothetical protein